MITVIYRHRYQEENRALVVSVVREWRRFTVFNRNKAYLKKCLEAKQRHRNLGKALETWKVGSRSVLFCNRIKTLVEARYSQVLEQLVTYSKVNAHITKIASSLVT